MADELTDEEQPRVDRAYTLAETTEEQLSTKLDGEVSAGDTKTAHKVYGELESRCHELRALLTDPRLIAIGRLKVEDEHGQLDVTVGRTHLGENHDVEVIDWGSPLADAFFDPETYDGTVELIRRYSGETRRLTAVDQVLPRSDGGTGVEPPTDSLLEQLRAASDGRMGDVIATIQAEQHRLMRMAPDARVVIQGGPGTGKTVVGLHRVAMLLARHRDRLEEKDVLVVGPSDVFVRYIAEVLPDLGRDSVLLRSIAGLAGIERTAPDDRGLTARVKGDARMVEVIRRYLDQRIGSADEGLEIGTARIEAPVISELVAAARDSGTPYNTRRAALRTGLQRALEAAGGSVVDIGTDLDNALNRLMPDRAPRRVVADLLTGRRLLAAAADGRLSPSEQAAVLRAETNLETTPWTRQDAALIDEASFQLSGLGAMEGTYAHIVIDEAQNLSPMELRMFERRSAQDGGMTVLGDLAQSVSPWSPRSWTDHFASADLQLGEVLELTYGYRIPAPVMDYANRLLDVIDVDVTPPDSIIRDGRQPLTRRVPRHQLVSGVLEVLQEQELLESVMRTAVVVEQEAVDSLLAGLADYGVVAKSASDSIFGQVTVVTYSQVGGLEFDHVIAVEPEHEYRRDGVTGPRSLYVAMTRARRTLTLLHVDELPRVLQPETSGEDPDATGERESNTQVEEPLSDDRVEPTPPILSTGTGTAVPAFAAQRVVVPHDGGIAVVQVHDEGFVVHLAAAEGGVAVSAARGLHQRLPEGRIAWTLLTDRGASLSDTCDDDVETLARSSVAALVRHLAEAGDIPPSSSSG